MKIEVQRRFRRRHRAITYTQGEWHEMTLSEAKNGRLGSFGHHQARNCAIVSSKWHFYEWILSQVALWRKTDSHLTPHTQVNANGSQIKCKTWSHESTRWKHERLTTWKEASFSNGDTKSRTHKIKEKRSDPILKSQESLCQKKKKNHHKQSQRQVRNWGEICVLYYR